MPDLLPAKSSRKPQKPLAKWMVDFAMWFATSPDLPNRQQQHAIAEQFKLKSYGDEASDELREGLPRRSFYALLGRPDFQALVATIQTGGVEAARAMLMSDLPEYVALHKWGAQRAKAKDDVKTLATYTSRALDVVAPRKGVEGGATHAITINISPAALQSATPIVEAEFVELPPEVHDDTDD